MICPYCDLIIKDSDEIEVLSAQTFVAHKICADIIAVSLEADLRVVLRSDPAHWRENKDGTFTPMFKV